MILFIDYVRERAKVVINSDLADNLGNLFSRVTAPKLNPPGLTVQFHRELFPLDVQNNESRRAVERDYDLLNSLYQLPSTVTQHYSVCEFSHAITAIMEVLHMVSIIINVVCLAIIQIKKTTVNKKLPTCLSECLISRGISSLNKCFTLN